jgi:RNA polymerase sigma factor (sigma-70 family)
MLVEDTQPHVRRFAYTLCASREDAEDAAQEALLVLYRRIGTLRASAALASWVFKIVSHECLRRARLLRDAPGVLDEDVAVSAEDAHRQRYEAHRIAAAIAALPDEQRRVVVLRDVQGRSGREVCEQLGLSAPAMKSRLHRARAAVRDALTIDGAVPGGAHHG